jgi:hypothetical protein
MFDISKAEAAYEFLNWFNSLYELSSKFSRTVDCITGVLPGSELLIQKALLKQGETVDTGVAAAPFSRQNEDIRERSVFDPAVCFRND